MSEPLTIAIDFDNTWSALPTRLNEFAASLVQDGHRVICVTGRSDTPENWQILREFIPMEYTIYFAGRSKKSWYMAEERKVKVHIWIDDDPQHI